MIIDLWEEEICHLPVKIGGNRHRGIGDIQLLNFHVTLRDHVVGESCDIMAEFPSS